MRVAVALVLFLTAGLAGLTGQTRSSTLDIYFIDTEGPTGESLLVAASPRFIQFVSRFNF